MCWECSLCNQIHFSNSIILMWNCENSRKPFIVNLIPPCLRSVCVCLYEVLCCPLGSALVPYFPNVTGQLRSTKFSGTFFFSWLYFLMSLNFFLKEYDFNSMRFLQLLYTLPFFYISYGVYLWPKVHLYYEIVCETASTPWHGSVHGMLLFRKLSSDDIAAPWHRHRMKSYKA